MNLLSKTFDICMYTPGWFQKQFIIIHVHCKTPDTRVYVECSQSVSADFFLNMQFMFLSIITSLMYRLISALSCLLFQVFLLCPCFNSSLGDQHGSLILINLIFYTASSYLKNIPGKISSNQRLNFFWNRNGIMKHHVFRLTCQWNRLHGFLWCEIDERSFGQWVYGITLLETNSI